jgi:hypothetical protein
MNQCDKSYVQYYDYRFILNFRRLINLNSDINHTNDIDVTGLLQSFLFRNNENLITLMLLFET